MKKNWQWIPTQYSKKKDHRWSWLPHGSKIFWILAIFVVEHLREYESIFETALAHESVDPEVLFDEKTGGRKSREAVPLN
jgi:hypothetical protein